jgi:hypothetical protein
VAHVRKPANDQCRTAIRSDHPLGTFLPRESQSSFFFFHFFPCFLHIHVVGTSINLSLSGKGDVVFLEKKKKVMYRCMAPIAVLSCPVLVNKARLIAFMDNDGSPASLNFPPFSNHGDLIVSTVSLLLYF